MASQNIKINIGSSFNSEGMDRAAGAVGNLSRNIGKTAGAISRLGGSFESMGGAAGKAIGNVSNLLGAIATGGWVGAITAGITTTISLFQKSFEAMDEMKKKHEELAKAQEKAKKSAEEWIMSLRVKELSGAISAGERYVQTLNRIASAEAKVVQAQNQLNGAMSDTGLAQLQAEISNSVNSADGPDAKARAMSAGNIRIAEEQYRITKERQSAEVESLRTALANAKAVEMHTRASIEAAEATSGLKADHTKLVEATKAREAAEIQLAAAEERQRAAMIRAQTSINDAKAANDELIKAQKEAVALLLEENHTRNERKALQDELKAAQEDGVKEIKAADKKIKDAKEELAEAIKNTKRAFADGDPKDIFAGLSGEDSEGLRRRISSTANWGSERSFNPAKAQRWADTHGGMLGGLSQSEQREYNNLAAKAAGGQQLSESQRKRLHELASKDPEQQRMKAEAKEDKAREKVAAAEKAREKAVEKMQSDIDEIRRKLEDLGLQ